ncbi:ribonuclease H-like domain-containing protein [Tanacetum coccineum]
MAYKVYSLESKLVFYSRDVKFYDKFYEIVFPFKINSSLQSIEENHDNNINNLNFFDEKHLDDQTSSLSPNNDGRVSSASNDDGNVQPCTRGFDTSDGSEADFATSIGDNPFSEGNSSKPTTYYEAVKNLNWIEAVNNEIEALIRNNTWTICDLPKGRKAVGSKWLINIKYKSTGAIDRYKARLVAKDLFQRDINNAFLYGDISKDVYMTLPPGFDNKKGKV